MCPFYQIGSERFSSYITFNYLGFLALIIYIYPKLTRIEKFGQFDSELYILGLFATQPIGGQIIPFIYKWYFIGHFPQSELGSAGRYFHSALLTAVAYTIIYCKIKKWPTKRILDYLAISACLMSAIGRIGCFLGGCCGGKPTDLPWGVRFPRETFHIHPTQLYHFGFEFFILFPLLIWINNRKRFEGETFWMFIWIYSFFRFWIEFIRMNPVAWADLTHAQIFSAIAVFVSGIILIKHKEDH